MTRTASLVDPPRSTVFAVVAATTIAQVAAVMGFAIFPVIAPRLAPDLGVPASTVGYQLSIAYGVATLATMFSSGTIPRFGACRATQAGLALCAAGMLLAMTASIAAIVAASVLLGLGMSVMTPASTHLLFRFSPAKNRNLIFSIKQTGVPLGWLVIALTAPGITFAFGWRWALAMVMTVAIVTLVALQRVRERWDDDRKPDTRRGQSLFTGVAVLWRVPSLRWLAIATFFLSFVQLCLSSFLVIMLVEEVAYTLVAAGLLLSVMQCSGVIGRVAWGWLTDRSGDGLAMLFRLNAVMLVCCALAAFVSPAWPVYAIAILCVAFGATAVGWNGIFLAEIARRSPRGMVSVATGGAMVWNFGGILAGPATFATAYKWIGSYTATFGWLTIIAALGLLFITLARTAERTD
jgi:predicted MFS family arabinose efflux permease